VKLLHFGTAVGERRRSTRDASGVVASGVLERDAVDSVELLSKSDFRVDKFELLPVLVELEEVLHALYF
jgi:hypothetical protein